MSDRVFTHSGDLGDIIYALPTIKALGGGKLILFDMPGRTAHGMTKAKVDRIKPLLMQQEYITDVEFSSLIVDSSLNGFRDHVGCHGSLCDAHLATHGLGWEHRASPWLKVFGKRFAYDVIIHRSERYHNQNFPWHDVLQVYEGKVGYMGFEVEHRAFCSMFGDVPRVEACNFLEMAEVINGAKLFIGNQSSPLAVAHGMFKTLIMEICPGGAQHHCVFQRLGCIIGWDGKIIFPNLSDL